MAIIDNKAHAPYNELFSQYAIMKIEHEGGNSGTWVELSERVAFDETRQHTGDAVNVMRDRINEFRSGGDQTGAVIGLGVFRRLNEADEAFLAKVVVEGKLVYNEAEISNRERTEFYQALLANGETEASARAKAELENVNDDSSTDPVEEEEEKEEPEPVDLGDSILLADVRFRYNYPIGLSTHYIVNKNNVPAPLLPAAWFADGVARRFGGLSLPRVSDGFHRLTFRDEELGSENGRDGELDPLLVDEMLTGFRFRITQGDNSQIIPENAVWTKSTSQNGYTTPLQINPEVFSDSPFQPDVSLELIPPGATSVYVPPEPSVDYGGEFFIGGIIVRISGSSYWLESPADNQEALIPANWFQDGVARRFARLRLRADGQFRLYFRVNDDSTDPLGNSSQDILVDEVRDDLEITVSAPGGYLYATTIRPGATKTTFYAWNEPTSENLNNFLAQFVNGGQTTIGFGPPA